jgi:cytochrome bd ubiquinol oxidase subunit II
MPIEYESLRFIWWALMGIVLALFAIMDGFDLGIGMMLLHVGKTDNERRVLLNSVGPVWEGNQVWLILGGGAVFAAWPMLYAISFSGFYFAILLLLLTLMIRPVGFKYRSKVESYAWRQTWDIGLFLGGLVPACLFGVALGNVIQGVPFSFDQMLRVTYTGNLFQLLNPFALLCGGVSIAMLLTQGGIFLAIKTEDHLQARARKVAIISSMVFFVLFISAGFLLNTISGYSLTSVIPTDGPSNPLFKTVVSETGSWLSGYSRHPIIWIFPLAGLLSSIITILLLNARRYMSAFLSNSMSIACTIGTVGSCLFPFILPSSTYPQMSLLIWDSSSSQMTLFVMLIATIIFLPLIIFYTSWVYRALNGKITVQHMVENSKNLY